MSTCAHVPHCVCRLLQLTSCPSHLTSSRWGQHAQALHGLQRCRTAGSVTKFAALWCGSWLVSVAQAGFECGVAWAEAVPFLLGAPTNSHSCGRLCPPVLLQDWPHDLDATTKLALYPQSDDFLWDLFHRGCQDAASWARQQGFPDEVLQRLHGGAADAPQLKVERRVSSSSDGAGSSQGAAAAAAEQEQEAVVAAGQALQEARQAVAEGYS